MGRSDVLGRREFLPLAAGGVAELLVTRLGVDIGPGGRGGLNGPRRRTRFRRLPSGGGDLMPDYPGPGDDVEKILEDNGGNKPRRVKDLMVNLIRPGVGANTSVSMPSKITRTLS